ncbi:hypothetical protein C8D88_116108 [Lentzea atacamensis]|uniref:Uncharacterized protein n=1 Tax=Lentzea atacamensis TaxID=531938 RepID=A0A316HNT1_9PSEU|nr:hypothetical protein [Lentzea atacamensis]PWK81697.1 hypothetical protein C8D88_116108 [Lentzea atacamensis]
MNSAEHKAKAEELLAEAELTLDAVDGSRLPADEAYGVQLSFLVAFARIQAHATLALYPGQD